MWKPSSPETNPGGQGNTGPRKHWPKETLAQSDPSCNRPTFCRVLTWKVAKEAAGDRLFQTVPGSGRGEQTVEIGGAASCDGMEPPRLSKLLHTQASSLHAGRRPQEHTRNGPYARNYTTSIPSGTLMVRSKRVPHGIRGWPNWRELEAKAWTSQQTRPSTIWRQEQRQLGHTNGQCKSCQRLRCRNGGVENDGAVAPNG